ncbi:MAG: glutamate racemase [Clostridiales bacterium]|nr:glutamate racemase [Clostridiales bacterium]
MQSITQKIAFFDSGIGGLTVLSSAQNALDNQIFYYYGDNARAPYGNLSNEKILQYVEDAFTLFQSLKVDAVVLACNTATAVCAESLRGKYSFPIIGAEPAVLPAMKKGGNILVLSTRATFQSARFQALCESVRRRCATATLTAKPCDGLAGAIEQNLFNEKFDFTTYLPKPDKKYSTVVLGCTHYIYIKEIIENYYGCKAVDGNDGITKRLKNVLGLALSKNENRERRPLVTASAFLEADFVPVRFLGSGKEKNKHIYEQMFAIRYK